MREQANWLLRLICGTSLVVQGLRLCASTARGVSSIHGWGTKIPHAARPKKKKKKKFFFFFKDLFA